MGMAMLNHPEIALSPDAAWRLVVDAGYRRNTALSFDFALHGG